MSYQSPPEQTPASSSARKRIYVACVHCRKRKIKRVNPSPASGSQPFVPSNYGHDYSSRPHILVPFNKGYSHAPMASGQSQVSTFDNAPAAPCHGGGALRLSTRPLLLWRKALNGDCGHLRSESQSEGSRPRLATCSLHSIGSASDHEYCSLNQSSYSSTRYLSSVLRNVAVHGTEVKLYVRWQPPSSAQNFPSRHYWRPSNQPFKCHFWQMTVAFGAGTFLTL
ncbi:hypothetical protein FB451DRAFT_1200140 [Mycena latifolia]|nr:hypothetical protein FB451DRAFT_1200140 [Mycena latifolia]